MSFTDQEKSSDGPRRWALSGDLLDFTAAPRWGDVDSTAVRFDRDNWLLIEDGRIVGRQAAEPDDSWMRKDHAGKLVLPGFIDTHVHCPQLDVIASYGTELLDWLKRYTFPAECAFADPARSRRGAEVFLDALLASGTTSAVVFPTVHKVSAEALFEGAAARGMRLITGKVLMDRHAPDGLRDDVVQAEKDCVELIDRFHGRGRNAFAVTVRFAPTSTPEQLAMAGALCRADASLYMQTHVAENRAEVEWVAQLFPDARSYLDVYAGVGLVHERAVLAHGIWLDDTDKRLLADRGAQVAHCPSSNLFLGSGLFDWRGAPFNVSLASDVGGGTSLNLPRNMADAYKVQALRGERLTAWSALHAATRGAAEALRLGDEIGGLSVGQVADLCVWDWAKGPVAEARDAVAGELHERVFAWMTLADERNLAACYVAGQRRV
ncbi:guanine deaminase [Roseateles asaccharophilus]|uniref:Guanine deaminase n=1 Tax=Roseateles asaccharophilus TaxID=582607 RepID=A0ABU2A2I1_9BURK|nr:guanine deaminase [Roseateles asaccharophilus]MDR7331374.1 guanine deaminase [Roseateles asaccharophilus]